MHGKARMILTRMRLKKKAAVAAKYSAKLLLSMAGHNGNLCSIEGPSAPPAPSARAHIRTHTHADAHIQTVANSHKLTQAGTNLHKHTQNIQTYTSLHTPSQTFTHLHKLTQTYRNLHKHTNTNTNIHTRAWSARICS